MPRDSECWSCGGMFHDDEMEDFDTCIYCAMGLDSGVGENAITPESTDG